VALKILPDAFASDPDRLARFKREAQILASLDHPIIAAIEEADGTRALVLELVEDPTLADLISKGPIPLDEALPIAKQIAEALEAAHETGVMHRDLLKPANIKVRKDGTVKVLDFGLAKAFDPNPEGDPSQGMWSEQAYARVLPQVVGVERPGGPHPTSARFSHRGETRSGDRSGRRGRRPWPRPWSGLARLPSWSDGLLRAPRPADAESR